MSKISQRFIDTKTEVLEEANAKGEALSLSLEFTWILLFDSNMSITPSWFPRIANIRPVSGLSSLLKLTSTPRTRAALTFGSSPFLHAIRNNSLRLSLPAKDFWKGDMSKVCLSEKFTWINYQLKQKSVQSFLIQHWNELGVSASFKFHGICFICEHQFNCNLFTDEGPNKSCLLLCVSYQLTWQSQLD